MRGSGFRSVKSFADILNKELLGLKTPTGIEIIEVSKHFYNQMINRKIEVNWVKDAIVNPLHIFPVKVETNGVSQKLLGKYATISINPDTGILITVWETGTKDLKKYVK